MRVRRVATLAVVLLGSLAGLWWAAGWLRQGSETAPPRTSPRSVYEIPSSLPFGGVRVGDVVLKPWTSAPRAAMSADRAIKAALVFTDRSRHLPVTALQADLTLPGSNRKPNVPVWVVTLAYPKPEDVGVARSSYASHQSVAVDAVTGKFVLGFYER